jgi:DNA-binding transcriptional ArsR family regulator
VARNGAQLRVTDVFDALADPNRRYVLEALAQRETATATELAAELPVTRQAVAKHLAALNEAGLVESRREGRETRYELTPEPLDTAMDWIASVGTRWDARLDRLQRHLTGGSPRRGGGARRRG